jgi:hypothetical protein
MKWTVHLELTPNGNPQIKYGVGATIRPIAYLSRRPCVHLTDSMSLKVESRVD